MSNNLLGCNDTHAPGAIHLDRTDLCEPTLDICAPDGPKHKARQVRADPERRHEVSPVEREVRAWERRVEQL